MLRTGEKNEKKGERIYNTEKIKMEFSFPVESWNLPLIPLMTRKAVKLTALYQMDF